MATFIPTQYVQEDKLSYSAMRRKRFTAGVLAGAMAFSVMPILGFTGTAGALEEPTGEGSVCEGAPESDEFTDVTEADPSAEEIECLVGTGITTGTGDGTTYEPNAPVTRRQMALFLVRLADQIAESAVDGEVTPLPDGDGETDFTDIGDEAAEIQAAIDALADAGITTGVTDTEFRPNELVTRRQMAKFIVRLQEFLAGEDITPDDAEDAFTDDDGDSGEEELNVLAAQGVFEGDGEGNVNPGDDISRRQMANVIVRTGQYFFEEGATGGFFTEDEPQENATATTRPELVSADIVQTNLQGTTVRYIFDEALTGTAGAVTPGLFHVYNFTNLTGVPDASGTTAQVESGNAKAVLVNFSTVTTAGAAGQLSVATVDEDAVTGLEGNAADQNVRGDAPLNPGSTSQLASGVTAAPDLATVANFRADPGNPAQTLVDFTFDEAAYNVATTGYRLVGIDGTAASERVGTFVAGAGTATHTVAFSNAPPAASTVTITPATIARGTIDAGTVGDSLAAGGGNLNPAQAADVSTGGNSETPDLESALLVLNQETGPGTGVFVDAILYTFDEPVVTPVGMNFAAYNDAGAPITPAAPFVLGTQRSTTNDRQVAVPFGLAGTLNTAVGASASDGAVVEGTGSARPNQQDEVGVANVGSGPTTISGRTNGPDLTDVAVAERRDAFGALLGARVTYTFDEDVFGPTMGDFQIVLSDGARYSCTAAVAVGTTEETDNTVTCDTFDTATTSQIMSAVVGTVDDTAINNQAPTTGPGTTNPAAAGTEANPEGAAIVSGSTGTPAT